MALPKVSLTTKIFIGLILGILLGWLKPDWGIALRPLSILFLNLIKSVIAPLIFSTLVIGIAGTGDIKQVGRIGLKSLVYFEIVTTFALFIGLAAVNLTKPGVGVSLKVNAADAAARGLTVAAKPETVGEIIAHPGYPDDALRSTGDGLVLQRHDDLMVLSDPLLRSALGDTIRWRVL